MSEITKLPAVRGWLTEPLKPQVAMAVDRLRRVDDVQRIALMPDIHLASDVCVGCIVATSNLIYPQAVGGDIGCGMAAVGFDCGADIIGSDRAAARVLAGLYECVPLNRHARRTIPQELPARLRSVTLSNPSLDRSTRRDGLVQLGTLGRGNHFLELQRDEQGQLWLMVHSGSRAMGQAIMAHHLEKAGAVSQGLVALPANEHAGLAYLADARWAVDYARESRRAMVDAAAGLLSRLFGVRLMDNTHIDCDHNHVRAEVHGGNHLWVHRKGANSAGASDGGIIPGSMGEPSFHVEGRGCEAAMNSSSHGAGRAMSRDEARRCISPREVRRSLDGVWFDERRLGHLCEEAPAAYKDIRAVMRAQKELVRIVRTLTPVLCYKGT